MSFSTESGSSRRAMTDINVTPLVDVMLVLLIIFMVTAPLMQSGVKIDLPKASAAPIEHSEEKLKLSLLKNHSIMLGDTVVKIDDLEIKLHTNARVQKDKEIYLDADRTLPYGFVVEVMAIARRAGVESLGLMTEPDKEIQH